MRILYNIVVYIISAFIPLIALFSSKLRLFYNGRKRTFLQLAENIGPTDKTVWIHCASLGEFEQGRPIIERIKNQYPKYKIILSFFSPSGYEIRKNYDRADAVVYLPIDTRRKAARFIKAVHPSLAIFVKYEFWPNVLYELQSNNIDTILISGIFRKNQLFFKKQGGWYRNTLKSFKHFFVQDEDSMSLLKSIGFSNVTKSGDTRFDRVSDIIQQRKELPILSGFKQDKHTLVAGSTWPKDEALLIEYINEHATEEEKFIFAPHNISVDGIDRLVKKIQAKSLLFSKANAKNVKDARLLIIDSIGILTSVYYYADVAYVGGGFGVGIHNILEPATFGIPIIIGPNYQKFKEAIDLIDIDACFEINGQEALNQQLHDFMTDKSFVNIAGEKALNYIKDNTGATEIISKYIVQVLD